MRLNCASCPSSAHRGVVRCSAQGRGRRGSQHGACNSKQQQRKNGGVDSVSKMSAAAKAAAKRAARFSQQRHQRAVATLEPPVIAFEGSGGSSSSRPSWRDILNGTAAAAVTTDTADEGPPQLRPYIETVVEHLKQTAATTSSSNSGGRGRGAKRAAARDLVECHTAVFQAALDVELQEEWREAEERLQSWPVSRLSSEGVALFGLAAAPDGGMFRDVLLKFFLPSRALPFHAFSQGDILLVSRGDPLSDSHEAVVVDYSSRWMRLALNPTAAAAVAAAGRAAAWRLDLFANTISHERCCEAVKKFAAASSSGAFTAAAAGSSGGHLGQQVLQQQEVLWRVLAGVVPQGQSLSSLARQSPPWLRSPQGRDRLAAARTHIKTLLKAGKLNQSQCQAVEAGLTGSVTLWQGPPGTGKTTTLIRLCECAVGVLSPVGGQVLAVAASNVAVDNLVAGLLDLGVRVVRIGQPVKIAPALRSVSLDVLAAATVPGQAAAKLRQQLVTAAANNRTACGSSSSKRGSNGKGGSSSSNGSSSSSSSSAGGLWEQMLALEAAAAAEVLGAAQVVAATCVGAGDPVVADRDFELVVLDEATQATEPAALIATAARAQALVLVGDPQQLPPTVKSRAAEQLGLTISLFNRLQAMGLQALLLDVQYRMHPAICEFPGAQFYGGRLKSWPKPQDRTLPGGLQWPNPKVPVMFVQCNGPESRANASISINRIREDDDDSAKAHDSGPQQALPSNGSSSTSGGGSSSGYSFYNNNEAAAVVQCVQQLLLSEGLSAADVGVITPYSGQVRAIRQLLGDAGSSSPPSIARSGSSSSSRNTSRPLVQQGDNEGLLQQEQQQRDTPNSSSGSRSKLPASAVSELEVKSVDGFQGREKEVIVFSTVRSNPSRKVGFLADYRRLNVALTRAKRGLVVVGDARTLRADSVWARWLQWAQQQGVVAETM